MTTPQRVRATLGFGTKSMPDLVAGSTQVHDKISANTTLFANPPVPMTTVLGLIQGVTSAQGLVVTGVKGARVARDAKCKPLITALDQTVVYVQSLADLASPGDAANIIISAGLKVAAVPTHNKPPLRLTNVQPSGSLRATAFRALLTQSTSKVITFHWQYSSDEKSWIPLPSTPVCSTTISGLTLVTTVFVRVSVTIGKQPMSAWSAPVSIVVQ